MATEILRPNGVGSETSIPVQFPDSGNHWDKVDEIAADGDSTYVMTQKQEEPDGNIHRRDLYALPNPTGSGVINKITLYYRYKGNESLSGDWSSRVSVRTHSTTYNTGITGVTASYVTYSQELATNPYTEAAWTWDELNALEAGPNLYGSISRWTRCTQFYVEVDYTLGVPGSGMLRGLVGG